MIKFIISKIQNKNFRSKWRLLNKHNFTVPTSIFPIDKVKVGKMSYGSLEVKSFGNKDEELIIGDYVSIAENVLFILGENHQINSVINYPLFSN